MAQLNHRQIKEIFNAALQQDPSEREQFLDKICGADGELRSEVESLLSSHEDAESFRESPVPDNPTKELHFGTGQKFGHYKIIERIGVGGMGEVYLAEDELLNRRVAIKLLNKKLSRDVDKLNRFIQEAKAASALNHPNILTIHEIGKADDVNYIATEFIEGRTLREELIKNPLPIGKILAISIQMAKALSAAHQAGIIHRDIKPDNVMIREDGIVKVLDFGLAKLARKQTGEDPDLEAETMAGVKTVPGLIMGTPQYMSPEQARGKKIDHRTDIFSFGIVLYQMLSRRLPFDGETVSDIIASILTKEPLPLTDIAANFPDKLERISRKILQKEPADRYQTFKELVNDLEAVRHEIKDKTNQETIILSETKLFKESETISKESNKDALLLTEFNNLTGDEVFDGTLRLALRITLEQSPFINIFPESRVRDTLSLMGHSADETVTAELGKEICQRKGLKAFITGTIAILGTVYMLTLEAVNAQTGETLTRQLIQVESKGQVLKELGKAATGLREELGESLGSIKKFDAPLELTTSSLEALKLLSLGYEQTQKGKYAEAISFTRQAIEIDPDFAFAYTILSANHFNLNQPKLAAKYVMKAYELRGRATYLERLRISESYYSLGTGEFEKAIETAKLCRKIYPHITVAMGNLSFFYGQIGRFEEAVKEARQLIEILPNSIFGYWNLAGALVWLGEFTKVKKIIKKALERKLDGIPMHAFLYWVAFWEKDTKTMKEQIAWFRGKTVEYIAFDLETGTSAFNGQWRQAKNFSQKAINLAVQNGAQSDAAQYSAEQALRIVFWRSGTGLPAADDRQLRMVIKSQVNKSLNLERNQLTLSRTALALAFGGETEEVENLVDEMLKEYPKHTLINKLWIPTIKGVTELQKGNLNKALGELEIARQFERVGEFYPQYIRGLSHLKLNENEEAEKEFQKILDHPGEGVVSSLYPLAQLGKARATRNKKDYEKFFEMWKDADEDMPALIEAKKEYKDLN